MSDPFGRQKHLLIRSFAVVNRLSSLADFLENDSLPAWLKKQLQEKRTEISEALDDGKAITLTGPNGEQVTISLPTKEPPKAAVA